MHNRIVAVVALTAVFTLAICFIILGAISSDLMQALNIDEAEFASLGMALFLTSCVVQLVIGPTVDKFGYKPVAIIGFVVTSASMFLLAFAGTFATAFAACVLFGIGAMSCNTVGNTLIPVVLFEGKDPARASNFGNAFFGMGYLLTPFLFTLFLRTLGMTYSASLSIFGVVVLIFLVISLTARYPQVPSGFEFGRALSVLGRIPVLIAALALFCYMSLEVSMGMWIRRLMEELFGRELTAGDASFWAGMVLSLFGLSMMCGRFISSAIKNLTAIGVRVIAIAALVSLGAIIIMSVTESPALGILAVILIGLAFAPIFPTVVGVTFAQFDSSLYGSIFGIIFAVGLLGATFVPKYIGNLSAAGTVQGSLTIAAVMAGLLFLVALVMGVVRKR
ncbi:MAG TPA: MFS transporter [Acidobacteriota bacterium]|nr:MFS transporter [Acidobacteriota bacterium]